MNTWRVKLFCVSEDGSRRLMHKGVFYADTEADARECATDAWWDMRLEAAGCSPDFEVQPVCDNDDLTVCTRCGAWMERSTGRHFVIEDGESPKLIQSCEGGNDHPPEDICPFCLATRDYCECEEMGGENA
jgi:hypothetical protein